MGNYGKIAENIEYIRAIDWWSAIIAFLVIGSILAGIIAGIFKLKDIFVEKLGITTKKALAKQAQDQKINSLQSEIYDLRKDIQQFKDDRIHDREQSFNIQKQLTEKQDTTAQALTDVNDKLDNLAQVFQDMQKKEDFKERSKLKDRISQAYRYYHKEQKWTEMDKESFNDLIRAYEASGGSNSFVHSVCEPESLTWEVIE